MSTTIAAASQISDEKIYAGYRLALRALKKEGPRRTAARKQAALRSTALRHRMPVGAVKALVRKYDEHNGVTHEHTAAYAEDLKLAKVAAEAEASYKGVCPTCTLAGMTAEEKEYGTEVRARVNHYYEELEDRRVVLYSCIQHYLDVAYDI